MNGRTITSATLTPFSFTTVGQIIARPQAASELGEVLAKFGARHVLVVADATIIQLGLASSALASLARAGIAVTVFDDIKPDPAQATVLKAAAQARKAGVDAVVGFGGGSSMDVAKLIALLAHPDQSQPLSQMYGVDNVTGSRLPLVQVPTTAGTGSEVTAVAIVSLDENAQGETAKMGVVSSVLYADVAILDATLTLGLPPDITAVTAIDAMVHAIEAFTSKRLKNPYSDMLAVQALKLLDADFAVVMKNGQDVAARHHMLLGACLAGQAFANAPVAAVHALAYPLGGFYHLSHGLTNSLVLLEVLKFNQSKAQHLYAQLYAELDPIAASKLDAQARCEALFDRLNAHIAKGGFATRLRDYGVAKEDLPKLAASAMKQTRLLQNNPREVSEVDALTIYKAAY